MKFSQRYLDALFTPSDYGRLAEISSILCGCDSYEPEKPNYGFDTQTFVFVESLLWFAQAQRSGVWTYFEATPTQRKEAMLEALQAIAPKEYPEYYALGMKVWNDEGKIKVVDTWMQNHDEENNRFLWRLATKHRASIERLCA